MSSFDLPLRSPKSRAAFALLSPFVRAYFRTAIWVTQTHIVPQLGFIPDFDDIHPDTIERMMRDCSDFLTALGDPIASIIGAPAHQSAEAGADFWLSRHGRDIGFLDGDWPSPAAAEFDATAKSFGLCALYLGGERRVRHLDIPPRHAAPLSYCKACQASPRFGFCTLDGCPHAPSDLFAARTLT